MYASVYVYNDWHPIVNYLSDLPMPQIQSSNLVRKQVMLSRANIEKLDRLARLQSTSAAEIVRSAIDYYDPQNDDDIQTSELIALVSSRLKEVIKDTRQTRKKLNKTLQRLETNGCY